MTMRKAGGVYPVIAIMSLTLDLLPSLTPSTPASKWLQEKLLHRRMGHLNQEYVRLLPKAVKQDFRIKLEKKELCESCIIAKQRRKPNREPVERS